MDFPLAGGINFLNCEECRGSEIQVARTVLCGSPYVVHARIGSQYATRLLLLLSCPGATIINNNNTTGTPHLYGRRLSEYHGILSDLSICVSSCSRKAEDTMSSIPPDPPISIQMTAKLAVTASAKQIKTGQTLVYNTFQMQKPLTRYPDDCGGRSRVPGPLRLVTGLSTFRRRYLVTL
ncbi:hypothetical protein J6590_054488 [Homalodisca vitripennis]|nr:hypothetical protein J6590_054488 [Homalodisca vitripennis]